jgi:hypothetical protein
MIIDAGPMICICDRRQPAHNACLIALANSTRQTTIITLDGDFRIYRLSNGQAPLILPE